MQTPFVLFAVAKVSTFFKMPNILKEKITFFLFFYKICLCAFSFIPLMRKYWCGNMVEILAGIVLRTVKYFSMRLDAILQNAGDPFQAITKALADSEYV